MRNIIFSENEFYHIYNRGVDKRNVFNNGKDVERFFQSMLMFNTIEPIGSIFENSFNHRKTKQTSKPKEVKVLVNFTAYCLNPNHYHFIIQQVAEKGVEKFMHRLGTGYTKYFNAKNKRTGSLFQGKFKATHIESNDHLLHLSAYVNLNGRVHQLGSRASKLVKNRSSWLEYLGQSNDIFCKKDIILGQFKNSDEYKKFALETLERVIQRKGELKEIKDYLLE
jgi:REP element-mobilizing transposase RayT